MAICAINFSGTVYCGIGGLLCAEYPIDWQGGGKTTYRILKNEEGQKYMELSAHNVYAKFVPFGDGGNDGNGADNNGGIETALATAVLCASLDGPLPIGDIIGAYIIIKALIDNPQMPKPWYTDRPNNYIPSPFNEMNNKNYFPQSNGNDLIKWLIRIGGGAALGKKLYDGLNPELPNVAPLDNTYVQPFYAPIPNH